MSGDAPLPTRALERCLACGGRELRPLAFRYEFRGRFPAAECRGCGMRFLRVQPAPEALADLYGARYFQSDFRCGRSPSGSFSEEAFRGENRGLLDAFERLRPPGRLLEVGCASGLLLKHAIERGWEAQGVELSAEAVERARALGLVVFRGDLPAAGLKSGCFDLVYMGDVLEHVPDCRAVLAEVARVLVPGGHLYLRGPITTNSLARRLALAAYGLAGRELVLREPPYHLWEFTPRPLWRLFETAGLTVLGLRQSKIPPGRPHGEKTPLQRAAVAVLDVFNLPLTRLFNVLGDRVVVIGQKR
jgi:SAM-dependent methyltransferase